jgi:hypothetical protein
VFESKGARDFSLLKISSYSMDTWVLFHSSPSSAAVKKSGAIPLLPYKP